MTARKYGRGRPQELGASGNLIRGLEAPVHSPQEQLPARRLFNGVRPAKRRRRQRTAATILHPDPPREAGNPREPATPATEASNPRPSPTRSLQKFSRRHGVPKGTNDYSGDELRVPAGHRAAGTMER